MNNKGQVLGIIAFFAIVIAVFIVGVVLMYMTNKILTPMYNSMNATSDTRVGAVQIKAINDMYNKWWDWAIVFLFIINVMILLISSFMIDIHPAFLILYIFAVAFLFIFGSSVLGAVQEIYTKMDTGNTSMTGWIINNFMFVMLGIVVLSGIVMYAKFKFGNQATGGPTENGV